MATLQVYSRRGCHLCDVLLEEMLPLVRGVLDVEVRDIDTRPEWHERYFMDIPVVTFGDQEVCRHRLDREALGELLAGLTGRDAD